MAREDLRHYPAPSCLLDVVPNAKADIEENRACGETRAARLVGDR